MRALECLTHLESFDALAKHIGMPGQINGKDLADAARQRCSGLGVLLMSGYMREALSVVPYTGWPAHCAPPCIHGQPGGSAGVAGRADPALSPH